MKNFPTRDELKTDNRVRFDKESEKYVFYDPTDEIEYEFDPSNGAWYPRWNEKLVIEQQSAYSKVCVEDDKKIESRKRGVDDVNERTKTKKRSNTSVYITGLPLDTTEQEVEEYFKKCGTIMPDIVTGKPRIKLYQDDKGILKGDGTVMYYKEPSVQLAIDILDDSQFRMNEPGRIHVQQATFKEKPHGDNNLVKKSKVDPSLVKKRFQQLEKKHDWEDEISVVSEKYQRIVVLKGMFTQQEIKDDVTLLIDLKEDIREECEKVGEVTSIKILEDSPEGVVTVKYKDAIGAQAAVELLNGRFFAGRQIEATISTGKVKTKHDIPADSVTGTQDEGDPRSSKPTVKPSKEGEEAARLADYAKWLEGE